MWRLYLGHHLGTRVGSVREGAGLGGRWLLVGFPESQTVGGLLPLEHELGTLDVLQSSDLAHANAPWFVVPHPTVAPIWNSKSFLP